MADENSFSPTSSPEANFDPPPLQQILPASINHVWEHPLVMLVQVPGIPGHSKQTTYWKCLAPGCNQQCNGKNATKALAHGSRDRSTDVVQLTFALQGTLPSGMTSIPVITLQSLATLPVE